MTIQRHKDRLGLDKTILEMVQSLEAVNDWNNLKSNLIQNLLMLQIPQILKVHPIPEVKRPLAIQNLIKNSQTRQTGQKVLQISSPQDPHQTGNQPI